MSPRHLVHFYWIKNLSKVEDNLNKHSKLNTHAAILKPKPWKTYKKVLKHSIRKTAVLENCLVDVNWNVNIPMGCEFSGKYI